MPTIITIKGIEESINNLQYRNKSALKYQLVHAIGDFYQDEKSIEILQEISSDELIKQLWPVGNDPAAIKNRRKNLNSIKSTINADLKKLYQEGKNPEGIIIGPANVFVMSDEAKEAAFAAFRSSMEKTGAVDLGQMLEVLNIINESLSNVDGIIEKEGASAADKLKELQSLIQGLSGKVKLDRAMADQRPLKPLTVQVQEGEGMRRQGPLEATPIGYSETPGPTQPLKESFDYSGFEEEPEINGETLEEVLDQEETDARRPDEEPASDDLAEVTLDQLDEMALEEREAQPESLIEEELVEEDLELVEDQAEQAEPQETAEEEIIEDAADLESAETETLEAETEEVKVEDETEVETEEPEVEEEIEEGEIAEDTAFVAEETTEEIIDLTEPESLDEIEEEPEPEETLETVEIEEEPEPEVQELEAQTAEEEAQDLSEEILESEVLDEAALPEDEELPEDLEAEEEQALQEEPPDLENLETVETLPEPEELLEEAAEDVEELDLDAEGAETEAEILPETVEEEQAQEIIEADEALLESEPEDIEEEQAETDELVEIAADEEIVDAEEILPETAEEIAEEEPEEIEAIEEEAESAPENEQVLEIEADEEVVEAEEIPPETAEEVAEDELEEVEASAEETESAEPEAEEFVEEADAVLEAEPESTDTDYEEEDLTAFEAAAVPKEPTKAPQILPEGLLGVTEADIKVNLERARYLAEEFNDSLAAMDKFHNQYLLIPGGSYLLGSRRPPKDGQAERIKEMPAFYIGKFPVTNALFEVFIEKTGYKTTAEKKGGGLVYYPRCRQSKDERSGLNSYTYNSALVSEVVKGACWYQPCGPGSTLHRKRSHPVVQVSLEDAMAFASWTGKRLPTEEEWEAAGRGSKGLIYPWGGRWKKSACNVEESEIGDTTPVEHYLEDGNEFGLEDMLGNVLEWTLDPAEENDRRLFIVKSASWISKTGVRLTDRLKLEKDTCSNILGFRCVAY